MNREFQQYTKQKIFVWIWLNFFGRSLFWVPRGVNEKKMLADRSLIVQENYANTGKSLCVPPNHNFQFRMQLLLI